MTMRLIERLGRRWRLGRKAVAAVEFAIIAPVLLLMFIGTAEMLLLYRTQAKLNAVAANVAEMVSVQSSPLLATSSVVQSLSDICTGAVYGLQPFPPTGMTVAIVSVTTKVPGPSGTYDIWEVDNAGGGCANTATAIGATAACALALDSANGTMLPKGTAGGPTAGAVGDNLIIVRATLTYPGIVGVILGSAPTFTQTAYSRWVAASTLTELTCVGSTATTQTCT